MPVIRSLVPAGHKALFRQSGGRRAARADSALIHQTHAEEKQAGTPFLQDT